MAQRKVGQIGRLEGVKIHHVPHGQKTRGTVPHAGRSCNWLLDMRFGGFFDRCQGNSDRAPVSRPVRSAVMGIIHSLFGTNISQSLAARNRHSEGTSQKGLSTWHRPLRRVLAGFRIRFMGYPSGARVYIAQARGPGGARRVTLGRHEVVQADRARRRAAAAIARIVAGEDPLYGSHGGESRRGADGDTVGRPRECSGSYRALHRDRTPHGSSSRRREADPSAAHLPRHGRAGSLSEAPERAVN